MDVSSLDSRLEVVEAQLEIGQLPIRYALAVDQRDVDSWLKLFDPMVNLGKAGQGRDDLRKQITPQLKWFYRSIHQIVGHRVELLGPDHAVGQVYCRAEHEVGSRWIVMAIRYDDEYRKIDGEWLFSRRRERHWYATDVDVPPQDVDFDGWGTTGAAPPLPAMDPPWSEFWQGVEVDAITSVAVHGTGDS